MKPKILVTGVLAANARHQLEAAGCELCLFGARELLAEQDLIQALRGMDAYIFGGDEHLTARILAAADCLKLVCFMGAGYQDFIDVKAAAARGITVCYTPGANKQAVAEMTIALMLAAWRQIPALDRATHAGEWKPGQYHDLWGKTLGLIGMGAIGQTVAQIAHHGFGMPVLYFSRSRKPLIEEQLAAQWLPLAGLLPRADVVSIHLPYDPKHPDTAGLIGAKELALMKKSAVLINTARAQVVDGHALYQSLASAQIAAAAFDVYYTEPAPVSAANDPYGLTRLPSERFILTPHAAWRTVEADETMGRMVVENVFDYFAGRSVKYGVPTPTLP